MEKIMCDGVDIFNPLKGREEQLINAFVEFYGEEYRERIEQKFNDTTFIFLPKLCPKDNIFENCADYFINKMELVYRQLDAEFGIDLKDSINGRYSPMDIDECIKAIKKGNELNYEHRDIVKKFASALNMKLIYNPFNDQYSKKSIQVLCGRMEEYYSLFEKKYLQSITDYAHQFKKIDAQLRMVLPDMEEVEERANRLKRTVVGLKYDKLLTSLGIDSNSDTARQHFNAFFELACMGKVPRLAIETQKHEYIELFNFLGIYRGNLFDPKNYELYVGDEEINKKIFTKDLLESLEKIISAEITKSINENEPYNLACKVVEGLDIKYREDFSAIKRGIYNLCYTNSELAGAMYSYLDSNNRIKQVVFCGDYFSEAPQCLIHEFNHAFENNLIGENNYFYIAKTGFDVVYNSKHNHSHMFLSAYHKKENRHYRYLSEIINEYFANEIYKILSRNDNIKFGACDSAISLYNKGFFVFNGFIDKNLKRLIEIRLADNPELIQQCLGGDSEKLLEIANTIIKQPNYDVYKVKREVEGKFKEDVKFDYKKCSKFAHMEKYFDWSAQAKSVFDDIRFVDSVAERIAQMPTVANMHGAFADREVANAQVEK